MVCGKGGYVRSIARDLGRALGCLGHVLWLRREWSGPFEASDGVSLEDMVQLYAGIARGGVALPLRWRSDAPSDEGQRLLATTSAWFVGDILAGLAPPPGAPQNRLAYKTGTSYGHRDAWAIGYDGRHVIGVWMGRPDGTPVPGVFGADLAAPVLFQAFARLKPKLEPQPPAPPRR